MKQNKMIKFNIGAMAAILLLVSGVSPALAAKHRPSLRNDYVSIMMGIKRLNYSYSSKTHKITFSGIADGYDKLTIKYDDKTVKKIKLKDNTNKFKVTIPFKGYKTFKLYGDDELLGKTVSAGQYASKAPAIDLDSDTEQYLYFDVRAKKGDLITIWRNGKPIKRRHVNKSGYASMKVANTKFAGKAKVMVTKHSPGKKTSKGVELRKKPASSEINDN
ncbi:hypothetical protein [Lactobacillus xylocopicola]|uniref:Uncharacterized protein n=1 Tax=Lactobacillus xylocopicola TaxID=2976676 RepID=A0ABM8BF96_9LACO|nr:hypothetical protein [Lactobacillus xylocopicola]BDR59767.1 hypothetical protein KIM322_00280 [Lactobacillus xylocopicola]